MAKTTHHTLKYTENQKQILARLRKDKEYEHYQDLISLCFFRAGLSIREICLHTGLSRAEVCALVKKGIETIDFRKISNQISFQARKAIEYLIDQHFTVEEIAALLHFSEKSIKRELARMERVSKEQGREVKYSARIAHEDRKGKAKRSQSLRLEDPDVKRIVDYICSEAVCAFRLESGEERSVTDGLKGIVGKLKKGNGPDWVDPKKVPCVTTLYKYIRSGLIGLKVSDMPYMREETEDKVVVFGKVSDKIPKSMSIECRPRLRRDIFGEIVFGHWELDLVEGGKGGAVAMTLTEKRTRYFFSIKLKDKTSESVNQALKALMDSFGELSNLIFKTITTDNGSEFLKLKDLHPKYFLDFQNRVFYCHVSAPKEKAQCERNNREFRKYVKKGESIDPYSEADIRKIADLINGRPREILDYRSAKELFDLELFKLRKGINLEAA